MASSLEARLRGDKKSNYVSSSEDEEEEERRGSSGMPQIQHPMIDGMPQVCKVDSCVIKIIQFSVCEYYLILLMDHNVV